MTAMVSLGCPLVKAVVPAVQSILGVAMKVFHVIHIHNQLTLN